MDRDVRDKSFAGIQRIITDFHSSRLFRYKTAPSCYYYLSSVYSLSSPSSLHLSSSIYCLGPTFPATEMCYLKEEGCSVARMQTRGGQWRRHGVGGTGGTRPPSIRHQNRFFNSSKSEEKLSGEG